MPITPYHFGPGLALKACAPEAFSLTTYLMAQVIIDLEPLYYLLRNDYPWHRFMHTLTGATLVAVLAILGAKPCRRLIELVRRALGNQNARYRPVSWMAITLGAIVGAYSHIALDSIMHDDVFPLSGISQASPWYGAVPIDILEYFCLVAGMIGVAVLSFRSRRP